MGDVEWLSAQWIWRQVRHISPEQQAVTRRRERYPSGRTSAWSIANQVAGVFQAVATRQRRSPFGADDFGTNMPS